MRSGRKVNSAQLRASGSEFALALAIQSSSMARDAKRKKKRIRVAKEAKRRARLGIGPPPPERVIVDKRLKPPKHKKHLLAEDYDATDP